ncbi:MAG TPA: hypothetical protein VGQ69_11325 [Gemmatimonadales bacterium]|nr:hypothetical protein [Gemmatimonadales bacterium]
MIARQGLHTVTQPLGPPLEMLRKVYVGPSKSEAVQVSEAVGVVEGAERERSVRYGSEQVPGPFLP